MRSLRESMIAIVETWTVATTLFAWLPLLRILARPQGYEWAILGLSGAATRGPFWIFVVLTLYVLAMFVARFRCRWWLFFTMLLVWHLAVTGVVIGGVLQGGGDARLEGRGLHFSLPLVLVAVPCILVTILVIVWIIGEARGGRPSAPSRWTSGNTRKLVVSLLLLFIAVSLFRSGTGDDWITALAIVTTVVHWILLVSALEPQELRNQKAAEPLPYAVTTEADADEL